MYRHSVQEPLTLDLDNVGNSNESHDAAEKKQEVEVEVTTVHHTADDEAVESPPATGIIFITGV